MFEGEMTTTARLEQTDSFEEEVPYENLIQIGKFSTEISKNLPKKKISIRKMKK